VAGRGGRGFLSRLLGGRRARRALPVRRTTIAGVCLLDTEIEVDPARWGATATACAGIVAEVAARHATVVRLGIVPGEPPVIAAFRPRRDVVATQVRDSLTAGASHRRPHLWVALAPGQYAAAVVDPEAPFDATPETVAAIVASGRAPAALLTEASARSARIVLHLVICARHGEALALLRYGREALSPALR
jgi:hypothetical protein